MDDELDDLLCGEYPAAPTALAHVALQHPSLVIPGPKQRTSEQHHIVCHKMREARLRKKMTRHAADYNGKMRTLMDAIAPFVMKGRVQLSMSRHGKRGLFGSDARAYQTCRLVNMLGSRRL